MSETTVIPRPSPVASDILLHSGNSGFIVHRRGQLEYGLAEEGRAFSAELVGYMNAAQPGIVSTYLFEELMGVHDRLHWFVHMQSPHDYQRLLDMVDHDKAYLDISELDRLPDKGGGNWERMFTAGSFSEHVLCPQHGFSHPPDGEVDPARLFADPARYQTSQDPSVQLNTANAGVVLVRTVDARYDVRTEARAFAIEWLEYVNRVLAGDVTAFLFEEMFGRQDRLHWLIHLRSLEAHGRLLELARSDPGYTRLHASQRLPTHKGGGAWGELFVPASMHDTVLTPYRAPAGGDR